MKIEKRLPTIFERPRRGDFFKYRYWPSLTGRLVIVLTWFTFLQRASDFASASTNKSPQSSVNTDTACADNTSVRSQARFPCEPGEIFHMLAQEAGEFVGRVAAHKFDADFLIALA